MTKTEVDRFRAVLTARVAELERFTRQRDAIAVERCADQLEEIQAASQRALAVCNPTENSTNFETPVRLSVVSRKAALGPARSAMKTSTRSGLPRRRGPHVVYGARKS